MKAINRLALMAVVGTAISFNASAATLMDQIVGTWSLASIVGKHPDGSTYDPVGSGAKGLLMFDRDGRVSLLITGDARRKFASNNRLEGSSEENKGVAQGSIAYFGTYAVNEADHTLTMKVERSSYPNWDNTDQKRQISITGDELKWTNPAASSGGSADLVWHRAK
jgi:hypothetical protein